MRDRLLLPGTTWRILAGEHWAVVGPNGSGKSSLVRAAVGEIPVVRGKVYTPVLENGLSNEGTRSYEYVSLERHRDVLAAEKGADSARYFSGSLSGRTLKQMLLSRNRNLPSSRLQEAVELFNLDSLINREIRHLSTGEMRRALLARALISQPRLIILDEPFEGLDKDARRNLAQILGSVTRTSESLILVTHRYDEIIPEITHLLCLRDGKIVFQGSRAEGFTQETVKRMFPSGVKPVSKRGGSRPAEASLAENAAATEAGAAIELRNVTVRFGTVTVLKDLTWRMHRGENWAIQGPNGSGKTTLLGLIHGDTLQAYSNDVRLFGRRRGSGESLWEIRQRIGLVSAELQTAYHSVLTGVEIVLSGFHDSIGLFRRPSKREIEKARQWLELLGITALGERCFNELSSGERRMVLIARAVVKSPEILLLDEPCQGLDPDNRRLVLKTIDRIGSRTETDLLYVSHHEEEMPACISRVLRLDDGSLRTLPKPP